MGTRRQFSRGQDGMSPPLSMAGLIRLPTAVGDPRRRDYRWSGHRPRRALPTVRFTTTHTF